MSRRLLAVLALLAFAGSPLRAQVPFASDLLPKREALSRLGLERQWKGVVPLVGNDRVMLLSFDHDMVFARTRKGWLYAFNAETGQALWSNRLGEITVKPFPASTNSFGVYVTNLNFLYALDKKTGRPFWKHDLGTLPSSDTACDEKRVMVGMANGMLYGFNLKAQDKRTAALRISDAAIPAWNWQTSDVMSTRPMTTQRLVIFGSNDGKVYVAFNDEREMLYRVATGGAIGAGFGSHGTRLLLVPSADMNLYGVDLLTSDVFWSYASGAPIEQEPLVADDDIFVVNKAGSLSSVDPKTGSPRWITPTHGGRLVSVGDKRIYLESHDGDLFMVDRSTGKLVAGPGSTSGRVGLNLREYDLGPTNRQNDRIYLATSSGMVICLRETGKIKPHPLRDPKALPFGYVPPEGVTPQPPSILVKPPAEGGATEGEKPKEEKPKEEKPAESPE
jgi:outer membrane protein assembly factor BamB